MDIQPLMLAYTAAATVAVGVTASFSASIEQTLFRLLPEEAGPHWARFVKFAVAVAAFAGGLPTRPIPAFIDRNAPPPPPPGLADGLMMVMGSASGALMAASWVLLIFFSITLMSLTAGRAYAALRAHREAEAREVARREEERKLEKSRQESEPLKRKEPAEPRPVAQDKAAPPEKSHFGRK